MINIDKRSYTAYDVYLLIKRDLHMESKYEHKYNPADIEFIEANNLKEAIEFHQNMTLSQLSQSQEIRLRYTGYRFTFNSKNKDKTLITLAKSIANIRAHIIREFINVYRLNADDEELRILLDNELYTFNHANQANYFNSFFDINPICLSVDHDEKAREEAAIDFIRNFYFTEEECLTVNLFGESLNIDSSNQEKIKAYIDSTLSKRQQVEEHKEPESNSYPKTGTPKATFSPSNNRSFNLKILMLKLTLALLVVACVALIIALTADVSSVPVLGLIAS